MLHSVIMDFFLLVLLFFFCHELSLGKQLANLKTIRYYFLE